MRGGAADLVALSGHCRACWPRAGQPRRRGRRLPPRRHRYGWGASATHTARLQSLPGSNPRRKVLPRGIATCRGPRLPAAARDATQPTWRFLTARLLVPRGSLLRFSHPKIRELYASSIGSQLPTRPLEIQCSSAAVKHLLSLGAHRRVRVRERLAEASDAHPHPVEECARLLDVTARRHGKLTD